MLNLIQKIRSYCLHVAHCARAHKFNAQLTKLLALLLSVLLLHIIAMMWLEGLHFNDAMWLTITTATTVGYGDLSPATLGGRLATIILLYLVGIALLAQAVGSYFEFRQEKRELKLYGNWRWNMQSHLVFFNCPNDNGVDYFYQVVSKLRQSATSTSKLPVIIVSNQLGKLPAKFSALKVVHVNKHPLDAGAFVDANVLAAHSVVILASDNTDHNQDSINLDLLMRFKELNTQAHTIVETVHDANRERFLRFGADSVLRPIRVYPELLARTIIAPGSQEAILDIFDSTNEECIRYDVKINASWLEVINLFVKNNLGTPISFINQDNQVVTNALGSDSVVVKAIFVVVPQGKLLSNKQVQEIIAKETSDI
jgi:voltage-gated potassium channel